MDNPTFGSSLEQAASLQKLHAALQKLHDHRWPGKWNFLAGLVAAALAAGIGYYQQGIALAIGVGLVMFIFGSVMCVVTDRWAMRSEEALRNDIRTQALSMAPALLAIYMVRVAGTPLRTLLDDCLAEEF